MFDFDLSDELKLILRKLSRKDPKKAEIINKKVKEIINSDHQSIDHYKNLRHDMKHLKRVHIDTHFVLTFSVNIDNFVNYVTSSNEIVLLDNCGKCDNISAIIYKEKNFILFVDFDHHDNIY